MSNDTTTTTTTTDPIADIRAQLRTRLDALRAETGRIASALAILDDGSTVTLLSQKPMLISATSAAEVGRAAMDDAAQLAVDVVRDMRKARRGKRKGIRKLRQDAKAAAATNGQQTKRAQNDRPLGVVLRELLADGPLSSAELVKRVQTTGFRSNAKNFRQVVYVVLSKDKGFKRNDTTGLWSVKNGAK